MSEHPKHMSDEKRAELIERYGFRPDCAVLHMYNSELHLPDLLEAFLATARKRITPIGFSEFPPTPSHWHLTLIPEGMRAVDGGVAHFVRNDMWDTAESSWEIRGYGYLISDMVDDTPLKGDVVVRTPTMFYGNLESLHEISDFTVQFLGSKPVPQMHYVSPGDLEM